MMHASPMHDIGKIGVPDSILLKPGKLEAEEFQIMKTHSEIGARILEGDDSALLRLARTIALTHHEKWDGSGYPRGLVGEEIPLEGRLTALADVYDALTSVRPYKRAWSADEAFAHIREQAGGHFDPRLAHLFLQLREEIMEIGTTWGDRGQ
jgi:putative two-component system response regulator